NHDDMSKFEVKDKLSLDGSTDSTVKITHDDSSHVLHSEKPTTKKYVKSNVNGYCQEKKQTFFSCGHMLPTNDEYDQHTSPTG
ncbi:hypothetical protein R6Q57_022690, partial [Mikania cordata]